MKTVWLVSQQAISQWIADGAFQLAAALSFCALIAMAPLVTVSLMVASMFYGRQAVQGELVGQITHYMGQAGAEVAEAVLANASQSRPGIAGVIGLIALISGGSAIFLQLQTSLNAVWHVAPRRDLPWRFTVKVRLFSMSLVLGVGLLLLVSTVASAALNAVVTLNPSIGSIWKWLNFFVSLGFEAALFAMIFKLLPAAVIRWKDVWIGALVTALLFEAGQFVIGIYLVKTAPGSAYGASGSLLATLLWIYYSALILLLGAEFTRAIARHLGRAIQPARYAYLTDRQN